MEEIEAEYWCHNCQKTVASTPDVLCIICGSPFIEEVHYERHVNIAAVLRNTDMSELSERLRVLYEMMHEMRGISRGMEEPESMQEVEIEGLRVVERLEDMCSICLHEHQDTIRALPCSHTFHDTCLRKWLQLKAICPTCKQSARPNRQI